MEKSKIYSGIGSRLTPIDVLKDMTIYAQILGKFDYTLRSGGAIGADTAFARGTTNKQIFVAEDATKESIELASTFHPAWGMCTDYVKKLMGRNAMIILGEDLKSPVNFVVCWTKDITKGGTSLGIKIARQNKIVVYNLFNQKEEFKIFLKTLANGINPFILFK